MDKKILLLSASAALVFTACGDENTTNVTEMVGPKTLAKGEKLKDYECSKDNIGEFVFVTDSASVYYCDGEDWQDLKGEKGEDGSSCTAKKNSDGDYELTCDGEKIGTIKNGKNGEPGDNGTSCTAKKNSDGDFDLSCDGEKVGTIKNGKNGSNGTSCTAKKNSDGDFDLSCDGKKVGSIKNGESATQGGDCKVLEEGAVITITCGEGDGATSATLYKAMCGTVSYDPEVDACIEGYLSCGVNVDDLKGVSFYSEDFNKSFADKFYEPTTSFCHDGVIAKFCDGKTYDPKKQYCQNGNIIDAKCGETDYNPLEKYCVDKLLVDNPECKGVKYFPETQYCRERSEVADYGYVVDAYYNPVQVYKTIRIGSLEWFAENMNRTTENSKCVKGDENSEDNSCITYGRLYTFNAANSVCPTGWRLPTGDEVSKLIEKVGKDNADMLKSTTGWGGYGTDEYGFAALAAGYFFTSGGRYEEFDSTAVFWTSEGTALNMKAVFALNNSDDETVRKRIVWNKDQPMLIENYASVRCVRRAGTFVVELN